MARDENRCKEETEINIACRSLDNAKLEVESREAIIHWIICIASFFLSFVHCFRPSPRFRLYIIDTQICEKNVYNMLDAIEVEGRFRNTLPRAINQSLTHETVGISEAFLNRWHPMTYFSVRAFFDLG